MKEVTPEDVRPLLRIVTNGLKFRVQRLVKCHYRYCRWFYKKEWITMSTPHGNYIEHNTKEDAQAFINNQLPILAANMNGWKVV
jgi:hypothetical protein